MAETGWLLGGSAENYGGGLKSWVNPENVLFEGATSSAIQDTNVSGLGQFLYVYNFNYNLPVGSLIKGVGVRISVAADSTGTRDDQVRLFLEGEPTGDNNRIAEYWPTSNVVREYGGSSDVWGLPLTRDQIIKPSFGVGLTIWSGSKALCAVVYIKMNIYYEVDSHNTSARDNGVYKKGPVFIKDGGIWKPGRSFVRDNGAWKS